jgi:hypothetical protein
MAVITVPGMFLTGDHASRPAATAVGGGTLYSCSTHSLIYQSDGAAWSTWATLGSSGSVATDTIWDAKGDLAGGTGANAASRLAVGSNGQVLTADSAEATGLKWAAAAAGGSGLVEVTQFAQATGSPAASVTIAAAASGSLLVLIGQNNGADYSGISSTNTTWTSRRADNVGGVGNLYIWTGAVSGGASGTTITLTGGGGGGSVYVAELPATTYSTLGSNGIYAQQLLTNTSGTTALKDVPAGRLVCFIVHGQGTTVASPAILSCPESWSTVSTVGAVAFGFSTGHDISGYVTSGAGKYYTLVDIVPA